MLIPFPEPATGEANGFARLKPTTPRAGGGKYEQPRDTGHRAYFSWRVIAAIAAAHLTFVLITEGEKDFFQRLIAAEYDIEKWKIERGFKSNQGDEYISEKEKYTKSAQEYAEKYFERLYIYDDMSIIEDIDKELDLLESHDFKLSRYFKNVKAWPEIRGLVRGQMKIIARMAQKDPIQEFGKLLVDEGVPA